MQITGTIQSIIYRNAENGWTVLELLDENGERLSAVGPLPLCTAGERVELNGSFVTHPRYGRQFKATAARTLAPATLSAIESYLGSGIVKGIGPSTARAIVAHFGMDALNVMDNEPERLLEIPGIGHKRCAMIATSYRETGRCGMSCSRSNPMASPSTRHGNSIGSTAPAAWPALRKTPIRSSQMWTASALLRPTASRRT